MIGLPYGEKKLSRYAGKTRMIGYCDDMLSCFHLIPERHGQTDRRTDKIAILISRVSVLTRDKHRYRKNSVPNCMSDAPETSIATGFLVRVFSTDFWYLCHWHYCRACNFNSWVDDVVFVFFPQARCFWRFLLDSTR